MAFIEAFPYFPATVTAIRDESVRVKTFSLQVLTPWPFLAGHHCVIRLTDENGYVAARDYSVSSGPSSGLIELSVAKEPHGEVSTWLHERVNVGDTLEISKPLGEHFTWTASTDSPLLLIGGGIGIAPLMSIVREHRLGGASSHLSVLYSARDEADLSFRSDLFAQRTHESIVLHTTRDGATQRRIDAKDIRPLLKENQLVYLCGPTAFVNDMEHVLHDTLSVEATRIRTERFG